MQGQTNSTTAIAALASFVIPGLGQLIQARLLAALIYFTIEIFIWMVVGRAVLTMLGLMPGWGSPWS
ncbi:MAG: hypothetical protein ACRDBP_15820, partial [Luteolibacter sp.]